MQIIEHSFHTRFHSKNTIVSWIEHISNGWIVLARPFEMFYRNADQYFILLVTLADTARTRQSNSSVLSVETTESQYITILTFAEKE